MQRKRTRKQVLELCNRLNRKNKKRTRAEILSLFNRLNRAKRKLVKFSINLDSNQPFIKPIK